MIPAVINAAMAAHAPLVAIVAGRRYRDFAGDEPDPPYLVWRQLAAPPSRNISGRPPADRYSIGVDVYSTDRAQSDALVRAARDALEAVGVLSSGPQSLGYDPETKLYGYTFTIDIFQNRQP